MDNSERIIPVYLPRTIILLLYDVYKPRMLNLFCSLTFQINPSPEEIHVWIIFALGDLQIGS